MVIESGFLMNRWTCLEVQNMSTRSDVEGVMGVCVERRGIGWKAG